MSSNSQKQSPKMCKSPKNINYQNSKTEKIIINEYENLNTNCTMIGSNNLHLVKKPQIVTNMSPAYSNPSPNYPPSPYSSPASLKSPSPQLKPPTPQPNTFPVMQIIHNSQLLARPIQTSQSQNIIKLKPHLNILPKPSASPQPQPKPSVSPQIVIPTNHHQQATIMPATQPLLLNQMPMLAPGVQFILRPQTAKIPTQVQTATATPQGLILQPGGQQLLHLQPPRSQPQMVRVLTNGMQLAPPTTTYVTHLANPPSNPNIINSQPQNTALSPKKKPKKKKQKLDLANIMKLSGIGDEDDIQFESDTSQSESEHNSVHSQPNTPQPQPITTQSNNIQQMHIQNDANKKLGNIQISQLAQPTLNASATPLVQVLNQNFQSSQLIPNATAQAAAQGGIPFNPFITPNFTINNGLMVQRSGGFKLTLGEDGRLILQHDPTLNQDLQSQLLLQSIFGLNGGLVLQPSIDQQVHSQTVQTIQQQSVQTIQQQTVQSQTIQTVQQQTVQPPTVQHSLQTIQQTIQPQIQAVQPQTVQQTVQQTIQHQTVQSQPISAIQTHQPMQIVQPQPIQNLNQSIQSQTVHSIQQQVQPTVQSIQSHIQGQIQSQIQGQIQSLLQAQNLQNLHQNLQQNVQQVQPTQNLQTQTLQSIQTLQNQPINIQTSQNHQLQNLQNNQIQNISSQANHVLQNLQQAPTNQQMQSQNHSQPLQNLPTSQPVQSIQPVQPILKVQPFQKSQPPVQTVHPQPIQTIHHHPTPEPPPNPPPTSYVVNLTPDQLEQLKRNGQLTVNGQTIFMQRPNKIPDNDGKNVKLSPKIKPVKKVTKIQCAKSIEVPAVKALNNVDKTINDVVKEANKTIVSALQAPPKHIIPQNHAQIQPQPIVQKTQPSAIVQPSIQTQTPQPKIITQQKVHVPPTIQQPPITQTNNHNDSNGANQDVERLLGQLLEENPNSNSTPIPPPNHAQTPQRTVHTIQLTPQKQQHLKSIQLQIQTLSARLTAGDTEMHNALKLLFQEQQKILASGKLLPPDKVYYHNNQLTIVNPTQPPAIPTIKTEPQSPKPIETSHSIAPIPQQPPKLNSAAEHTIPTHNSFVTAPIPPQQLPVLLPRNPQAPAQIINQKPPQQRFLTNYTKAQLIEQQMNTDQNGAVKPDIHSPFKDNADACKRLIRYHCFDQPVLSEKDLNKADEIFELTARHFIDKFSRMVDKYRCLLLKESMRQVQTSELMMLDRMFLAEEQQSLLRLRQELNEASSAPMEPPPSTVVSSHQQQQVSQIPPHLQQSSELPSEEYDEWACIQRELACLPPSDDQRPSSSAHKRSASSDSRLESLKKFRVDKHHKKNSDLVNNSVNVSVHNQISPQTSHGYVQVSQNNIVHRTQVHHNVHSNQQMQAAQQMAQITQGSGHNVHFSHSTTQHIVQHLTHTVHNVHSSSASQSVYSASVHSYPGDPIDEDTPQNNSIDEQVQSAIDSILNLQQNTNIDLDDAVSSILS